MKLFHKTAVHISLLFFSYKFMKKVSFETMKIMDFCQFPKSIQYDTFSNYINPMFEKHFLSFILKTYKRPHLCFEIKKYIVSFKTIPQS